MILCGLKKHLVTISKSSLAPLSLCGLKSFFIKHTSMLSIAPMILCGLKKHLVTISKSSLAPLSLCGFNINSSF
jgi:hypothetical protein